MKRDAEADEEHERARDLKVEVLSAEREVVLNREEQMDDKHRDESDVDTIHDDLCRHAEGKVGHEGEQGIGCRRGRRLTVDADGSGGQFRVG